MPILRYKCVKYGSGNITQTARVHPSSDGERARYARINASGDIPMTHDAIYIAGLSNREQESRAKPMSKMEKRARDEAQRLANLRKK
jgi:hypothetical protein